MAPTKRSADQKVKAVKKRTLKSTLPTAGFRYINHFADKDTADLILEAMNKHTGFTTNVHPATADCLLVEIFERVAERVTLVGRVGHYRIWNTLRHSVPWFSNQPGLTGTHLRQLATYLMQARLRAHDSPSAAASSQPLSRTAVAIDRYIALLRTYRFTANIPDPNNANWERGTYFLRPNLNLTFKEREKLDEDLDKAKKPFVFRGAAHDTRLQIQAAPIRTIRSAE